MAQRSLERDPHSVLARFDVISSLLRNAYYSMEHDPKAAERWINSALEICDRVRTEGKGLQYLRGYESETKAMLGESLVRQGKFDQGLALVKQQRAAEQEDIDKDRRPPSEDLVRTYRVEARALLQQGKREQALQQLQTAQKLALDAMHAQPNDLGPVVVLGPMLSRIGGINGKRRVEPARGQLVERMECETSSVSLQQAAGSRGCCSFE